MKFLTNPEVSYVDHLGSDLTVVNSARVSFNKHSSELTEQDSKLISYLAKHGHWTPFAHCQLQLRIKAPIFVARQLVKHQIGLVWNEVSRRYVDDEPEFYIPTVWRGRPVTSKQGSDGILDNAQPELVFDKTVQWVSSQALHAYQDMLKVGLAPEQARMVLPLNTMTQWYWTGSLVAFARVCKQRLDPHAQKETRDVAERISAVAEIYFPVSWKELMK